MIAQPVKGSQDEKQKILQKCNETIKRVKEVLSDKEEIQKLMKGVNKELEKPGEKTS